MGRDPGPDRAPGAFPLALVLTGVLSPGERRRIGRLLADMRRPRRGKRVAEAVELEVEQEEEAPV